jgi:hypothetical protein
MFLPFLLDSSAELLKRTRGEEGKLAGTAGRQLQGSTGGKWRRVGANVMDPLDRQNTTAWVLSVARSIALPRIRRQEHRCRPSMTFLFAPALGSITTRAYVDGQEAAAQVVLLLHPG